MSSEKWRPFCLGLNVFTVYCIEYNRRYCTNSPSSRVCMMYMGAWKDLREYENVRYVGDINTLRPGQNSRYFPDDIFKCIFLNENVPISIEISLNLVPRGSITNITTLVRIMACRRPGDKPLSEPMMVSLLTHICVTHPQWILTPTWEALGHSCVISYPRLLARRTLRLIHTEFPTIYFMWNFIRNADFDIRFKIEFLMKLEISYVILKEN